MPPRSARLLFGAGEQKCLAAAATAEAEEEKAKNAMPSLPTHPRGSNHNASPSVTSEIFAPKGPLT